MKAWMMAGLIVSTDAVSSVSKPYAHINHAFYPSVNNFFLKGFCVAILYFGWVQRENELKKEKNNEK